MQEASVISVLFRRLCSKFHQTILEPVGQFGLEDYKIYSSDGLIDIDCYLSFYRLLEAVKFLNATARNFMGCE